MTKIATQPFNLIRKIKNLNVPGGKVINQFGKNMKKAGYTEIYQRPWNDEFVVLYGKKPNGDTKTHILNVLRLRTKTNTVKDAGANTKFRKIDKSLVNESGYEISGNTKTATYTDNKLVKAEHTKRGWGA